MLGYSQGFQLTFPYSRTLTGLKSVKTNGAPRWWQNVSAKSPSLQLKCLFDLLLALVGPWAECVKSKLHFRSSLNFFEFTQLGLFLILYILDQLLHLIV